MLISLEAGCFGQKCTRPIGQNRPFVPALKCDLLGLAELNPVFVPALKCDLLAFAEPNRLFVPAVNCDLLALNRPSLLQATAIFMGRIARPVFVVKSDFCVCFDVSLC